MNNPTHLDQNRSLRKVAILIANLDDHWAQRVLAGLSAREAALVQSAAKQLGSIDPEEQRDVVEQFRRSVGLSSSNFTDGVELDASLLEKIEQQEADTLPTKLRVADSSIDAITDLDISTIVDMLSHEHPQTIAVVLSRLDNNVAAEVLSTMSSSLQADLLARLADLSPTDQQTLEVVESQLAQWINQHRQRQQRMANGRDLVQRILDRTPKHQQETILLHLRSRDPTLAEHFSQLENHNVQHNKQSDSSGTPKPFLPSATRSRISDFTPAIDALPLKSDGPKRSQPAPAPPTNRPLPTLPGTASSNPLAELEQVEDSTLLEAITQSDRQVVALALAGAGEGLMQRILRRLPRRQAKYFRHQLRAIGPTRLSDMLAAQQEFVQNVRQLAAKNSHT